MWVVIRYAKVSRVAVCVTLLGEARLPPCRCGCGMCTEAVDTGWEGRQGWGWDERT